LKSDIHRPYMGQSRMLKAKEQLRLGPQNSKWHFSSVFLPLDTPHNGWFVLPAKPQSRAAFP
jgi:hypothetical protein